MELRKLAKGIGEALAARTFLRAGEDWGKLANRVAEGNLSILDQQGSEESKRLEAHIANGSILLSGRHLQQSDLGQKGRGINIFANCSTSATSFGLFYLLLSGCGVGRSYDDDLMLVNCNDMPHIYCGLSSDHKDYGLLGDSAKSIVDTKTTVKNVDRIIVVEDSREGWAKMLEQIEVAAFEKTYKDQTWLIDFSLVRPKGSPIGGMQDRPASGPVPLLQAVTNIAAIKDSWWGEQSPWLQTMYVDHLLADCVVVGGARRSSRIATKAWDDEEIVDFIYLKRNHTNLYSSNNSVTLTKHFWDSCNLDGSKANYVFKELVKCSYDTGEPGILNVDKLAQNDEGFDYTLEGDYLGSSLYQVTDGAKQLAKKLAEVVNNKENKQIVNPCVTYDTLILTDNGHVKIGDVVGKSVNVWNGYEFSEVVPFHTGFKDTLIIKLSNGAKIQCTDYHKFVMQDKTRKMAIELKIGDQIADYKLLENGLYTEHSNVTISSIERSEPAEVYCFNEPKNHTGTFNGVVTGQCGEISLNTLGAYCVIGDIVPYFCENIQEMEEAARLTTRALVRTNLLEAFYGPETKRTNRIGVSLTGMHEFALKHFGFNFFDLIDEEKSIEFWNTLGYLKRCVEDEAEKYSKQLGSNVPHTNTTIKPAGSTSKLFALSEGAHLPPRREYLRWVQFLETDPLIQKYEKLGYPTKKLKKYSQAVVVGFPTQPEICKIDRSRVVIAEEATPEQQYKFLQLLEKYWIDGVKEDGTPLGTNTGNQISYTLKYDPKQVSQEDFADMLYKYQSQIKACSVMPALDETLMVELYEYLPEEKVGYEQFLSLVLCIDDEGLHEAIDLSQLLACDKGGCPEL